MNHYTLQETFIVHQYEYDKWEAHPGFLNYFEIIFIENGHGYHTINEKRFPYKKRDIFLIAPEDTHNFEIEHYTKFTNFKFTELLFSNKTNLPDRKFWLQRIKQLLIQPNQTPGDIIRYEEDRNVLWNIKDFIVKEFKQKNPYYLHIISNAISTSLSIISRNTIDSYSCLKKEISSQHSKIDAILTHIRQHVHDNNLTKISYLAQLFHMSQSSISTYFKKQTGESIHQYITKYKMQLAEQRLQQTEFTVAEIAYQLGYTDESHLTKTFKKFFLKSPRQYRKEQELTIEL